MVLINDNNNRCISDVVGWDFNLFQLKVVVACVRQLNCIFVFYLFFFLYDFEDVPRRSGFRRSAW